MAVYGLKAFAYCVELSQLGVAIVAIHHLLRCHLLEVKATSHRSRQLHNGRSAATFCSAACAVRSEASSCWVLLSCCCNLRRQARWRCGILPRSRV